MRLEDADGSDLGIIIDGSQGSATDFDIRVVDYAIGFGYPIDIQDWHMAKDEWQHKEYLMDWDFTDLTQSIYEECGIAVGWMNEKLPEPFFFTIEESALYLTEKNRYE